MAAPRQGLKMAGGCGSSPTQTWLKVTEPRGFLLCLTRGKRFF